MLSSLRLDGGSIVFERAVVYVIPTSSSTDIFSGLVMQAFSAISTSSLAHQKGPACMHCASWWVCILRERFNEWVDD